MTPDIGYILDEMDRRERGFAPHALLLYAIVRGMCPASVLEFGAGLSTRVILDALDAREHGSLVSIGTDPAEDVAKAHGFRVDHPRWRYVQGLSRDVLPAALGSTCGEARCPHHPAGGPLDLILHDGAHDAETVAADLNTSYWHLRNSGLLLVHDTWHSGVGAAVRSGFERGLDSYDGADSVTMPYGFGLTIIRKRDSVHGRVDVTMSDKRTSQHRTEPCQD